ncbi:uncharacterized protein K441DRAFT_663555 [Cenococcum geophilum 1.58]|uniref:uncharacterized protein n=1 Tax=Cenococcum geophilum 1.58 TaxID=794803 RepID=UPI00358E8C52|nr:hypothetical protein K441DRAFT_663555 [Cenococcum geophilum 1.58]
MSAWQPLSYFSASAFLSLVALQSQQTYRPFLLILVVTLGVLAFNRIPDLTSDLSISSSIGLFVFIWLLHITCVLCVEQHVSLSWTAAYKMLFNPRRIVDDSQRDVKKTKDDTAAAEKKSSDAVAHTKATSSQSHSKFLVKQLILALTLYTIRHFYYKSFTPYILTNLLQQLPHSTPLSTLTVYIRRIPYITLPETLLRIFIVIDFVLSTYLLNNLFHAIFSITFVSLLRLDSPTDWPPLFGSLSTTYSLRAFWSRFWHRLVARTYLSYSSLLTLKLFRIDPRSTPGRLLVAFLIFFLSGMAHAVVTWRIGFRCGWWQDLWWFCANFAGIQVEEVVKVVAKAVLGKKVLRGLPGLERAVGYAWTWGFLFWSLPKLQYPKMMCGVGM